MNAYFYEKEEFFKSNATLDYSFRVDMLKKLKETIKLYEDDIFKALTLDLNKPRFESYTSEIGVVYNEIDDALKNLKKWMKVKKVSTPLFIKPGSSYIYKVPKGVVLIISPWNYPFQLVFTPLIGAIASGNCVIVKPSNKSSNTEKIINIIINECFNKNYITTVNGPGSKVVNSLIEDYDFDHIFFTGSVKVGKIINSLASKKLTPVTLELGGKSPCIVFDDCDIFSSAKRIVWGKFYNAGQTCVAPDYLLIQKDIKDEFIKELINYINAFYKENTTDNLGKIIDENNFNRLLDLLNDGEVIYGGDYNKDLQMIFPTLISLKSFDTKLMKEEIFGPIFPIIEFENYEDLKNIINKNPNPLALYTFTSNSVNYERIIREIPFGGGCINNTLNHFVNTNLPFGGVRQSGLGRYHSKESFNTFSNEKSIYKAGWFEFNLKFPPYKEKTLDLVKKIMK